MPLRDRNALLNPLFHNVPMADVPICSVSSDGRVRLTSAALSVEERRPEEWWSANQADSWNNPRLGKRKKTKRLRRTKLALSARSRRTGRKTKLCEMKARDVSQQCHHRDETSVEELHTAQKVHTWSADTGSFVCVATFALERSAYLAGLYPPHRNQSNYS